jgi:transposase
MDTSLRGRRRHRSWPEALKREIVSASLAPGASVSVVARQYDVNTNQVFGWRKRFADEPTASPAAQLVPVVVTPDRADTAPPPPAADIIEIELASGHRVRIGSGVKSASLRLVLDALERR